MTGPVGGAGELTAQDVLDAAKRAGVTLTANIAHLAAPACMARVLNDLLAAKAPQGVDSQTICRKLDAVAQHLNLKGRPQSLDIATAVRLVEEGAEWAAKHIEERGRELDKLRATLNKVAKDIDGTSPNGESIARERIQSVLRPKPAPAADEQIIYAQHPLAGMKPANRSLAEKAQDFEKGMGLHAGPAPGAERLREALTQIGHYASEPEWTVPRLWAHVRRKRLDRIAAVVREALAAAPPPPANDHELLVGGVVRVALELAILRGDLRMDNGAAFEEMSESEREDVISDTWMAMHGEGTCEGGLVKELKAIYAALGRDRHASAERVRELEQAIKKISDEYTAYGYSTANLPTWGLIKAISAAEKIMKKSKAQ